MFPSSKIPLLVPNLPKAQELLPWLSKIDLAKQYTNFGPLVQEFEAALCNSLSTTENAVKVVTVSSGTAALELCIAALALPTGGKVLMPAFTFAATANAVDRNGLVPLFSDVDAKTWILTPEIAYATLKYHPICLVIPVATFGCPVSVKDWDAFTLDTGIPVLIDAAAAFGNQAIGCHTHVAFSFHATKPFGIGEGGALATSNAELAIQIRKLSNFGFESGIVQRKGTNAKLSEYAAAVGLAQLHRRPVLQSTRQGLWSVYESLVKNCPALSMQTGYGAGQMPAVLVVKTDYSAQNLLEGLAQNGIESRRWYCPPLHHHPAFIDCQRCGPLGNAQLPVTEALGHTTLGLPWFTDMTLAQCTSVVQSLQSLLATAASSHNSLLLDAVNTTLAPSTKA